MSELYLVVDAFDGEVNIFASKAEVEAFIQRTFQEGPILYQIITDAESLGSETFKPYLRELEIPRRLEICRRGRRSRNRMSETQLPDYEEYTRHRPTDGRLLSIVPADQAHGLVERLQQMRQNGTDVADLRIKKNFMRKCVRLSLHARRNFYYPRESDTFPVEEFLNE